MILWSCDLAHFIPFLEQHSKLLDLGAGPDYPGLAEEVVQVQEEGDEQVEEQDKGQGHGADKMIREVECTEEWRTW